MKLSLLPFSPKILVATLALSIGQATIPASAAERKIRCFSRFGELLRLKRPVLPFEAEADWSRLFGRIADSRGELTGSPLLQYGERDALFWTLYREIPESIRQFLRESPSDPTEAARFFAYVSNWYGISVGGFFPLLRNRYLDARRAVPRLTSYAEWEREGLERLGALERADVGAIAAYRAEILRISAMDRARDHWIHEVGKQNLPLVSEGGKNWLVVGAERYAARHRGRGLEVLVPREKIAIRADNPIETDKVIGQMQAGVRPPRFYSGHVGLDGRIYLDDGHHRLQTDGRAWIPIQIADPPHTLTLNVMFDFLGLQQPSGDRLVRFQAGQIPLRELFPSGGQRFLDDLQLLPAELRK